MVRWHSYFLARIESSEWGRSDVIRRRSGKLRYWFYIIPFAIASPFIAFGDLIRWSSPNEGKVVAVGLVLVIAGLLSARMEFAHGYSFWIIVIGIFMVLVGAYCLVFSERLVLRGERKKV